MIFISMAIDLAPAKSVQFHGNQVYDKGDKDRGDTSMNDYELLKNIEQHGVDLRKQADRQRLANEAQRQNKKRKPGIVKQVLTLVMWNL